VTQNNFQEVKPNTAYSTQRAQNGSKLHLNKTFDVNEEKRRVQKPSCITPTACKNPIQSYSKAARLLFSKKIP
jgi:hypothetical protein